MPTEITPERRERLRAMCNIFLNAGVHPSQVEALRLKVTRLMLDGATDEEINISPEGLVTDKRVGGIVVATNVGEPIQPGEVVVSVAPRQEPQIKKAKGSGKAKRTTV